MKKRIILPILGLTGLLVILTQGNFYKIESLPALILGEEGFSQNSQIQIAAKAYNAEESKKFLKNDLLKWGYRPIQISIDNQSPDSYSLSPDSIELPSVDAKKVAKIAIKASIPRSIGLKAASLLFWPFAIPSTIDSVKTFHSYSILKKDLSSKVVKQETVAPYSVFNRIVFVSSDKYQDQFDVTLVNKETLQSQIFHVDLSEQKGEKPQQEISHNLIAPAPTVQENYYLTHEK
jgi:hypothetical protein